jgi:carboxyl-terminal processing protease
LDQAVEIAGLFLDDNRLVVYTQGRSPTDKMEYYTKGKSAYGENLSLVVLVDGATASASEIVSGAIQDWDRGLVVGSTTYGKGLVQRVFEINSDVALKLTTAKYYIPSGRSIQKPERASKHPRLIASLEDGDIITDSVVTKEQPTSEEVFHTIGGRVVYGGGGVAPDVPVEYEKMSAFEANLYGKQMAFDFAVGYTVGKKLPIDFEVNDEMLAEFKQFLKDKKFDYKTPAEVYLDSLAEFAKREGKTEIYAQALENLKDQIVLEKEQDFDRYKDTVKKHLREVILRKLYGERGFYEGVVLKEHPAVLKAKELLLDEKQYQKLLQG